jgi:hypothetical protein
LLVGFSVDDDYGFGGARLSGHEDVFGSVGSGIWNYGFAIFVQLKNGGRNGNTGSGANAKISDNFNFVFADLDDFVIVLRCSLGWIHTGIMLWNGGKKCKVQTE